MLQRGCFKSLKRRQELPFRCRPLDWEIGQARRFSVPSLRGARLLYSVDDVSSRSELLNQLSTSIADVCRMTMTRVYESIQLVSCSRNMLRLSLSRHRVRWGENEEWGKDENT
jgi:hypothetical protein